MEKLIFKIKNDVNFSFKCCYGFFGLSFLMIVSAVIFMYIYLNEKDVEYLFCARELITGSFGVVVMALAVFYVTKQIYLFFKDDK